VTPFEFVEPTTLPEALSLLAADDAEIRPMGGGTALMLMMKASVLAPRRLVSLRGLAGTLGQVSADAEGTLSLGGLATLDSLSHSADVARLAPVIHRALPHLSNIRVRHVATVGGALAHADPHMDLPILLATLHAHVQVSGPGGSRELSVEDLITGYYETSLARNEIITGVTIAAQAGRVAAYQKVTTRAVDDWPALGLGLACVPREGKLTAVSVVVGAATDRPTRATSVEAALEGARADDAAALARAGEALVRDVAFTSDAQGSAAYKRELARVHLGRALATALAG
jgi:carbon-monoxide dehydrogenase medium subunit